MIERIKCLGAKEMLRSSRGDIIFVLVQTLLALALLLEKMAATIALECETAEPVLRILFLAPLWDLSLGTKK